MNKKIQIEEIIRSQVEALVNEKLDSFHKTLCNAISKPEYQKWGRFLTPQQAAAYVGCRSVNGMKSLIEPLGIQPNKFSSKTVRYDREELNQVNIKIATENFKKSSL